VSKDQKISHKALEEILTNHGKWLKNPKNGQQADLAGAELQLTDFSNRDLRQAMLQGSNLRGASFVGAKLDGAFLNGADLGPCYDEGGIARPANLEGASVRGALLYNAKLQKARLWWTDLRAANLAGVNLEGAELRGANLEMANLLGAQFGSEDSEGSSRVDLNGAVLFNANLANANLANTVGLVANALAGSILIDAKLPDAVTKFDGLDRAAEISKNASVAFIGMLAACGYSWLTIATTSDPHLITNSSSSPLPIAGTNIPIVGFYWAAPLVVLGAYLYFHLYLQRLWQALSKLPAFFPDGLALDEKAYPWLLTGLVRAHFVRLKNNRSFVSRLENLLTILLAWWIVPLTLTGFWARYLPRHDVPGTLLHVVLIITATWAGIGFFSLMRKTLQGYDLIRERHRRELFFKGAIHFAKGDSPAQTQLSRYVLSESGQLAIEREDRQTMWQRLRSYRSAVALCACLAVVLISIGAIEGRPSKAQHLRPVEPGIHTIVSDVFHALGLRTYAELKGADISVKPQNWTGLAVADWEKEFSQVKGAALSGADLRYARAIDAFAIKAELDGADLKEANFAGADFRNATLSHARLQGANLTRADLRGTVLTDAKLNKVDLSGALFDKYTDLAKANFSGAELKDADLSGADLTNAIGLTGAQLAEACFRGERPELPLATATTKLKPCDPAP
jgi:uncharacterized protein YjbI with pentapeptide repeats